MQMTILVVALTVALATSAFAADNMKAFPPADAGMVRHVLNLPAQPDESLLKVEIIVGQTVETDAVNRCFFGGKIEAQNIVGWGFTKYVVSQLGPMAGTRMAPDPSAAKVQRFVTLGGEPFLIRYNSKLPVVVYVPEGVEVRYRLWKTDAASAAIDKG